MDFKPKHNLSILNYTDIDLEIRVFWELEMIKVHPKKYIPLFITVNNTKLSKEFYTSTKIYMNCKTRQSLSISN